MAKAIHVAASAVLLSFGGLASAHSGGTDANGCHTNHQTGDYHCHKPKAHVSQLKTKATTPGVPSGRMTSNASKVRT